MKSKINASGKLHFKPCRHIHCNEDARIGARRRLPKMIFDFIDGAAGKEIAARLNQTTIDDVRLQPRILINVEERDLSKTILGQKMDLPFGIAPMGMCNLAWPGADRYLATAAKHYNIPHCISTACSSTLETMQEHAGEQAWFQLYAGQSLDQTMELVERAAEANYRTLILTVDVPQVNRRVRDSRNGFQYPFKMGAKRFFDFATHPRWSISTLLGGVPKPLNYEVPGKKSTFSRNAGRSGANWSFLDQVRQRWKGKLIVKGVLRAEDAVRIKESGVDAIYISNHGGRQLDAVSPAIAALPAIRAAVGEGYPLIFDSGIRSGEGIVKALALGADYVMLGRPMLYAVASSGKSGLMTLIKVLSEGN